MNQKKSENNQILNFKKNYEMPILKKVNLGETTWLTVFSGKNEQWFDIRHYYNDKPTRKGIRMRREWVGRVINVFEELSGDVFICEEDELTLGGRKAREINEAISEIDEIENSKRIIQKKKNDEEMELSDSEKTEQIPVVKIKKQKIVTETPNPSPIQTPTKSVTKKNK